jgi:anti-sigma B factor antagonist
MTFVDTALEFQLSVARLGANAYVATVSGEADMYNQDELRSTLWPLADEQQSAVIVDLCGVSFVDSTVLGILVALAKRLRSAGGTLVIVSDDPRFHKLIEITGLSPVLRLEQSLARAVDKVVGATAV